MKNLLAKKYFIIIWFLVTAVFNVCLFLLTNKEFYERSVFWVSYAFIMTSSVFFLVSYLVFTGGDEQRKANAAALASFLYLVTVFVIGSIFMGLSRLMNNVLWVVPFIVLLIISLIFALLFIFGVIQREWVKANPQKHPEVFDMTSLIALLYKLFDLADEESVKNGISSLIEQALATASLKSDKENVKLIEKQIFEYAIFLHHNVEKSEIQNVFNNIEKLQKLLEKRRIAIEA